MKEKPGEYIAIYWEDESDLEYVRGHVTLDEARSALEFGCGRGCGDFAHSIKHRWARWQPAPRNSDFDSLFVTRDDQARGCFAVTEVKLGKKMAPDVLAHPPAQPLTPEQIEQHIGPDEGDREAVIEIVRQVEKLHRIVGKEQG